MKTEIEWIPVGEKLPEPESEVLITICNKITDNLSVWSGVLYNHGWEASRLDDYLDMRYTDDFEVTAWAHLPEAYKDGVEKVNEVKLKPCPFCGGEAEITTRIGKCYAICKGCGAVAAGAGTIDDAAKAWNKRIGHETYKEYLDAHISWDAFPDANVDNITDHVCIRQFFGAAAKAEDCGNIEFECSECWDREMP